MSDNYVIKARNLALGYDDETLSANINLDLLLNEWLVLTGGNGSGKTTFLNTILGVTQPRAGYLSLNTQVVGEHNQYISYLPQHFTGFIPPKMSGKMFLLSMINLYPHLRHYNYLQRYELVETALNQTDSLSFQNKPMSLLSRGQLKRIYISRCFLNTKCRLLIMDEPFASLDHHSTEHIMRSIANLTATSLNIIVVSHDLELIHQYFKYIIHLKDKTAHICEGQDCLNNNA